MNRKTVIWRIALVIGCLVAPNAAAMAAETIAPAAPANIGTVALQPAPSIMVARLSMPLQRIAEILETSVPGSLTGSRNDVLGEPVRRDQLEWDISRGDIGVSSDETGLALSAELRGKLRIKGRIKVLVKIPFSAHGDVGARVTAHMAPELLPDWRVNPHVEISADVFQAEVPIKNVGTVSVRGVIREDVDKELAKLAERINADVLKRQDVLREAQKMWQQLCRATPFRLEGQDFTLLITPVEFLAANPVVSAGRVELGLGLSAHVRVESGNIQQQDCEMPDPLPLKIVPFAEAGGFSVSVPVALGWSDLSALVTRRISGQKLYGGDSKNAIRVAAEKVELSPYGADVRAKLTFQAGFDTFFGKSLIAGHAYVIATPDYDEKRQVLGFKNLRLTDESGVALKAGGAVGMATSGVLTRFIGNATVDIAAALRAAQRKAEAALGPFESIAGAQVELSRLRVDGITASDDNLTILVSASGSASIDAGNIAFPQDQP